MSKNKKLTGEQYWKWRFLIENMQSCLKDVGIAEANKMLVSRDAEIKKLNSLLMKEAVDLARKKHAEAKKNYEEYKVELEGLISMSLNDCGISDLDYSVTQLNSKEG